MEKIMILADVTCDLSKEIRKEFGVQDYITSHIHFSNGMDFSTELNWDKISQEEFYNLLANKKIEVNTAPPTPEEFYSAFEKYSKDGYKVLSMSISSKISSTYNVACQAAKQIKENYPNAEIYCFDSYKMTAGFGLLVIYAHIMKNEGKTFNEIIEWLENNKNNVHQMGPIDDLIVVARRGHISMGKAIMGNFAGVKPMGDCSRDGYTSVLAKAKGMKNALKITTQYVKRMATDAPNRYMIIAHSNREKYAYELKNQIQQEINPKAVLISDIFPASGTNIGAGMVGVYFLGQEITKDLSYEKKVINEIIEKM